MKEGEHYALEPFLPDRPQNEVNVDPKGCSLIHAPQGKAGECITKKAASPERPTQTPSTGLRRRWRKVPESDAGSVGPILPTRSVWQWCYGVVLIVLSKRSKGRNKISETK